MKPVLKDETSWYVEGRWLTGNTFATEGMTRAQAEIQFRMMRANPAVKEVALARTRINYVHIKVFTR